MQTDPGTRTRRDSGEARSECARDGRLSSGRGHADLTASRGDVSCTGRVGLKWSSPSFIGGKLRGHFLA
uniref:Uncharacterized protein n=1 Tax=Peronospora matthiolae TaxID=2874970 RepID=A0AAV1V3H2_9STRA